MPLLKRPISISDTRDKHDTATRASGATSTEPGPGTSAAGSQKTARTNRLADQLRANLKRRKASQRARDIRASSEGSD